MSQIDPELIETYRKSIYRVQAPQGVLTFYIDKPSKELAELHKEMKVECSAFMTAYHPYSVPVADETNEKAQQALIAEIKSRGFEWLDGAGEDAEGAWPAELSILVLGISEEEATSLASLFKQNGYVFCDRNAVPRLVLTR